MGWLFGWDTRKSLVDHLITGNGVKTIKSCSVGNNLMTVQEYTNKENETIRFACVYLIKGPPFGRDDGYGWGYKDVDESMGPCQTAFPLAWLDLLSPTDSQYALDWRKAVRERGEKLRSAKLGSKWKGFGHVFEIILRRSPTSFRATDETGMGWRLTAKNILSMEVQT
jgi:hypothetical protein